MITIQVPPYLLQEAIAATVALEQALPESDPARLAVRNLARTFVELLVETLIDDVLATHDWATENGKSETQPDCPSGSSPHG